MMQYRRRKISIICIILCITMGVLIACAKSEPNKIIERCSKAWHDMNFDTVPDANPKDLNWMYWQFFDKTKLLKYDEWKSGYEEYWMPQSGYFVAIGGAIILYDNNENEIGYYISNSTTIELLYTYNSGKPTIDKAKNDACQAGFGMLMSSQATMLAMEALYSNSYKTASEYSIETDTQYCKLSEKEISQIK